MASTWASIMVAWSTEGRLPTGRTTVGAVPIYALGGIEPTIHPEAFVHPDATVIGNVTIGAESTIWPQAVLRGDYGEIRIGARTSIQDGTVVHFTREFPTVIGDG